MTRLTMDILSPGLQVCDANGQVLGYFLPVAELERLRQVESEHQRLLCAWAQVQFTEEELDKAEQEPEEYSTAEVLRQLEQS